MSPEWYDETFFPACERIKMIALAAQLRTMGASPEGYQSLETAEDIAHALATDLIERAVLERLIKIKCGLPLKPWEKR